MTGQTNTFEVESPYAYWRTAQEYETAGDHWGAEIGYKAAVLAADNLPLSEYRRNFQEEINKHLTVPGYRTPPNIGPEELKTAYAELLTLPFAARVRLATFFLRQNSLEEANEMCLSALSLKLDDWITTQPHYLDIRQQLDTTLRQLNYGGAPRPTQTGKQNTLASQRNKTTGNTPPRRTPYNLPDITELWNAHIEASRSAAASDVLAVNADEPLSLDDSAMVDSMFACLKRFTEDLGTEERKRLGVMLTQPEYSEDRVGAFRSNRFYRFRASATLSTLSVRAGGNTVEIFIVPSRDLLNIAEMETDYTLRATFNARDIGGKLVWTHARFPLYPDDMRVTLRNLFKELIQQTSEFTGVAPEPLSTRDTHGLIEQLSQLSQQRTNLAEKIVYQQEMVQNRIARDIHDSVIADLLALKRAFEAHAVSEQQVVSSLEDVSQRLRNICSDLAPRDLQDWGLRTVVTDMVASVRQRLSINGTANVVAELPELPHQVSLHIYRIIQECLNNLEKHSQATDFIVDLLLENGTLIASVQDNGVGFDQTKKDTRKASQGGMGLDSIRERVELIRCFYPAQLFVNSQPGAGTKTMVQINLRGGNQ